MIPKYLRRALTVSGQIVLSLADAILTGIEGRGPGQPPHWERFVDKWLGAFALAMTVVFWVLWVRRFFKPATPEINALLFIGAVLGAVHLLYVTWIYS